MIRLLVFALDLLNSDVGNDVLQSVSSVRPCLCQMRVKTSRSYAWHKAENIRRHCRDIK